MENQTEIWYIATYLFIYQIVSHSSDIVYEIGAVLLKVSANLTEYHWGGIRNIESISEPRILTILNGLWVVLGRIVAQKATVILG